MTRWIEDPRGGRDRGPRALARAWVEVLARPGRFFRAAVAPGDQAPGLTFAMTVVLIEEATRLLLVEGANPSLAGGPVPSAVLALAIAVVLIAPAALHLISGIQTVLLVPFVGDRGGVGETVQVLAYATAPCALAGPAIPELRAACATYGFVLYVLGLATVHGTSYERAALAGAIPGALVFGYGFRGFAAIGTLLSEWYIV